MICWKFLRIKKITHWLSKKRVYNNFFGIWLFFLELLALGLVSEDVGALFGFIGIGTMIAGHLYPNTNKELSDAVGILKKSNFGKKS